MRDSKETRRIYLAADLSKVNRCSWCGTIESKGWVGTFCSRDCSTANRWQYRLCMTIFAIVCIPLTLISQGFARGGFFASLFLLVFIASSIFAWKGYLSAKRVPKDSRKDSISLEDAYVKSLVKIMECPNCDGKIDLSQIGPERIFRCEYCGIEGVVEILHED